MATYYVRPDGNDTNTGLGSTTGLAWKTIQKALGATGIGSGDTVYIAPGTYVEQVTVGGTYSVATSIIGDPLCTQFAGVTSAPVRLSAFTSDSNAPTFTSNQLVATSKNYLQFSNILFDLGNSTTGNAISLTNCRYWLFEKCAFISNTLANNNATSLYVAGTGTTAFDFTINRCIFAGNAYPIYWTKTGSVTDTTKVSNCLLTMGAIINYHTQVLYINNTFNRSGIFTGGNASASFPVGVYNNLFTNTPTGTVLNTSVSGSIVENYNRFIACATPRANVSVGANSSEVGILGVSHGYELLVGLPAVQFFGSLSNTPNANFGTTTNASVSDMFGVTWTGTNPDSGSVTYRNIGAVGQYVPTERNASTITIAPGSTSQSIELYLGATGLTASTSGLSARYNRTRTASVSIPLVARTIAQAWTSGGFAEVDATNMPGIYRLDLPDAALAAGADDVTVVVRGASGTNGAVMTVKLSSGGLTSAQTASAVWDASPAGYNDATTFGGVVNQIDATVTGTSVMVQDIPSNVWQEQTGDHTTHGTYGHNVLRADQASKQGNVTLHSSGGINRVDADVHAIANDNDAAVELKGALLHNGTDYISADLLSPITSAQTVRIGPFAVRTDAGGADGALDLNQSTAGAVVVQLTDAQGTGIDQTSATVQAKVYNVAGGLVATYTCTPAYAVNGFVSIPMTTAVTGTAGSYIINLWSTVGSTVIIYGPLQLRVRAI